MTTEEKLKREINRIDRILNKKVDKTLCYWNNNNTFNGRTWQQYNSKIEELQAELKGFLAGKSQATKEILEEVIKEIDIPVDTEKYRSEEDWIYAIVDACDRLVKNLKQQLQKLGEEE